MKKILKKEKLLAIILGVIILIGLILFFALNNNKQDDTIGNSILDNYRLSIEKTVKEKDVSAIIYYSEKELLGDYPKIKNKDKVKCEKIIIKNDKSVGLYNCSYKDKVKESLNFDINTKLVLEKEMNELVSNGIKSEDGNYALYKAYDYFNLDDFNKIDAQIIHLLKKDSKWYANMYLAANIEDINGVNGWISFNTIGIKDKNTASYFTDKFNNTFTFDTGVYYYLKENDGILGMCIANDCNKIIDEYKAEVVNPE